MSYSTAYYNFRVLKSVHKQWRYLNYKISDLYSESGLTQCF